MRTLLFSTLLSISVLVGCSGKPLNGTSFSCVVPAQSGTLLAKYNGKIALTDTTGKNQWCGPLSGNPPVPVPPLPDTVCKTACAKGDFSMACTDVTALAGYPAQVSTIFVFGGDLAKNINLCPGTLIGPTGTKQWHPDNTVIGGGYLDDVYGCIIQSNAPLCNSDTVASQSPALGTVDGGFDNYIARTNLGSNATIQSNSDPNQNGTLNVQPGAVALSFNIANSDLHITSLTLPFENLSFQEKSFRQGSIIMIGQNVVAHASSSNGIFSVPIGHAIFSISALDGGGTQYTLTGTNSTPLDINLDTSSLGPKVTGTISGSVDGHPVHADLHADLIWNNRPPLVVAKALNVSFNSSTWRGATDNTQVCLTVQGPKKLTWHGVPNAKVVVTLDGSASSDPDPGDSLRYYWNVTASTSPVTYVLLGAGTHSALLTVQDQYNVASAAEVNFDVRDLARPSTSDCGAKITSYRPGDVLKYRVPIGDPLPFRAVNLGYTTSKGEGITFNAWTREGFLRMAEAVRPGMGTELLKTIARPSLSIHNRQAAVGPSDKVAPLAELRQQPPRN